jgi:hypothetical protein
MFRLKKVWLIFNLSENRVVVGAQRAAPLRKITCFEYEPKVFKDFVGTPVLSSAHRTSRLQADTLLRVPTSH